MANNELLPFILEAISQKPGLCETYKNLCKELEYVLSIKDLRNSHENLQEKLIYALKIGQNLGILTITEKGIRIPFNINKGRKKPESSRKKVDARDLSRRGKSASWTQPRRTHTIIPIIPQSYQRKCCYYVRVIRARPY